MITDSSTVHHNKSNKWTLVQNVLNISPKAWLTIMIGLVIRLWVWWHTVIVNPDGVLYIHQARALYFKDWANLKGCGLSFLSSSPLFISAAYGLVHDWIAAAHLVSLLFGTALLFPLYGILRDIFSEDSAVLCLLTVAVTPVLVSNSVEIVKDPVSWFFLTTAVWGIVRYKTVHRQWLLLFSSSLFLLATWARIESLLFLIVTLGDLFIFEKSSRYKSILIFLSPVILIAALSVTGLMVSGLALNDFLRVNEIGGKITAIFYSYRALSASLGSMASSTANPSLRFFLPEAQNLIWLIAFGVLLNRFFESFFYPFVVFYVIGISRSYKKSASDSRILYLMMLTVSSFMLLYVHTLQTWMLYYRFMVMALLPGTVFCASGLTRILGILYRRYPRHTSAVFVILFTAILSVSLFNNLRPPDADKSVFIQIADTISRQNRIPGEIMIAASRRVHSWISFYANITLPGAPCPFRDTSFWETFPDDPDQFYAYLIQNHLKYVLWEENYWPPHRFLPSDPAVSGKYRAIGQWYHQDTGKMILYEVN